MSWSVTLMKASAALVALDTPEAIDFGCTRKETAMIKIKRNKKADAVAEDSVEPGASILAGMAIKELLPALGVAAGG